MRHRQGQKVTVRVSGRQEDAATILLVLATALATHGIKYSSRQSTSNVLSRNAASVQKSIHRKIDDGVSVEFIQE